MKWMIFVSAFIAVSLAPTYVQPQRSPVTGTCASIGYSTSCCPRGANCQAADGGCRCGDDCHDIHNDDCCSDVGCPTNPRTCADVGFRHCCNLTSPRACEIRSRDGQQLVCTCDIGCHRRGDCCSDARSTLCIPRTCAESGKAMGCCQWSPSSSCYVAGGNCYCDGYCLLSSDCCRDVVAQHCMHRSGMRSDQITNLDPSNGSVIVDFEGSINATTITCDVVNATRYQINTEWGITNFRELSNFRTLSDITAPEIFLFSGDPIPGTVPNQTYRNRLTVLVLSNDLDQVTIFCGSSTFPKLAHVSFRVYRKPKLHKNLNVRIQEGDTNVTIDLQQDPAPFPEPSIFNWSKDGQSLSSNDNNIISISYSMVTFLLVTRNTSGNYTVSATNFLLDNPSQELGRDIGGFYLNVLYPPSFSEGPTHRYVHVLLGDSISLVCGTGLDSNPQATITWTAPSGTTVAVMNNDRYHLENGSEIVRLNITNTVLSDSGIWRCDATVSSGVSILSGGRLITQNDTLIGSVSETIQVTITAPPGQPSIPTIESANDTWAFISWNPPLVADSPISYYEIIVRTVQTVDDGIVVIMVTNTSNVTSFNVTDLLPGMAYELAVVAVSEDGNITARSPESESAVLGFIRPKNKTETEPEIVILNRLGGLFGAIGGIILILILITVTVIIALQHRKKAVINKVEVVQEDEPQHRLQHLTRIAPDANSVDLELEQCPHCPAYVNASMK